MRPKKHNCKKINYKTHFGTDKVVYSYFMPVCSIVKTITPRCRGRPEALLHEATLSVFGENRHVIIYVCTDTIWIAVSLPQTFTNFFHFILMPLHKTLIHHDGHTLTMDRLITNHRQITNLFVKVTTCSSALDLHEHIACKFGLVSTLRTGIHL